MTTNRLKVSMDFTNTTTPPAFMSNQTDNGKSSTLAPLSNFHHERRVPSMMRAGFANEPPNTLSQSTNLTLGSYLPHPTHPLYTLMNTSRV